MTTATAVTRCTQGSSCSTLAPVKHGYSPVAKSSATSFPATDPNTGGQRVATRPNLDLWQGSCEVTQEAYVQEVSIAVVPFCAGTFARKRPVIRPFSSVRLSACPVPETCGHLSE